MSDKIDQTILDLLNQPIYHEQRFSIMEELTNSFEEFTTKWLPEQMTSFIDNEPPLTFDYGLSLHQFGLQEALKFLKNPENYSSSKSFVDKTFDSDIVLRTEEKIKYIEDQIHEFRKKEEIEHRKRVAKAEKILKVEDQKLEWESLFKDAKDYNEVIAILAKKKLVHEQTGIWIYTKIGYKSLAASLIKYVGSLGYYHEANPSSKHIRLIMKTSLGIEKCSARIIRDAESKDRENFLKELPPKN